MSRLIDADALIEAIFQNADIGFYGEFTDGSDCAYTHREIVDEINRIPTAYDIDKVVEQLEKASWKSYSDVARRNLVHLDDAIKTIRKGGVK